MKKSHILNRIDNKFGVVQIYPQKKHILSHQIIYAKMIHVKIDKADSLSERFIQINKKDIYKFAVPRLLEHFINKLDI